MFGRVLWLKVLTWHFETIYVVLVKLKNIIAMISFTLLLSFDRYLKLWCKSLIWKGTSVLYAIFKGILVYFGF